MRLFVKRVVTAWLVLCLLMGVTPAICAEELPVSAASAILMEAKTGRILYQKDAHTSRPMASTTKIMTALLAEEALNWDEELIIPPKAVMVEGSSLGLRGGDTVSAGDLITGMMLTSGNDAANALAVLSAGDTDAFVKAMNRRAAAIGMTHTVFETPSGLDEGDHSSTAYDMALLAREYLKNDRLTQIASTAYTTIRFGDPKREVGVKNHNRLLSLYPDVIGIKTGFTKKAGRCLVSAAKRDGVTLIAVTLKAPDDWNDHISLFDFGFTSLKTYTPTTPVWPSLPVAGSDQQTLPLYSSPPPTLTLFDGDGERLQMLVELPRFVWGGIKQNQPVGKAVYILDGYVLAEQPILAAVDVATRSAAGWFTRFWRTFGELLSGIFTY